MRPPLTLFGWVAGGIACIVLAAGCSTRTKQNVLHFFFTGMDETNTPPVVAADDLPHTNSPAGIVAPLTPLVYLHQPYLERKCDSCHLSGESEALRATGSALCLECHAKIVENAKFIHKPIRDGRCDQCHEAHKAGERFLLARKGQDVCLNCHKAAAMAVVKGHANMGSAECLSCHDAHRSDQEYLLKPRQ